MRLIRLITASLAGGLATLTGCPFGDGFGPYDYAIANGTYKGTLDLTASFWRDGVDDGQDFDSFEATRVFDTGDLINNETGEWFYPNDMDHIDLGSLQVDRRVVDVEQFDWGYRIRFDVVGSWYEVPLSGLEVADYVAEFDGTVWVEDTMNLFSLATYRGEEWEIEVYKEGTLFPSASGGSDGNGGSSGGIGDSGGLPDWWFDKSGPS